MIIQMFPYLILQFLTTHNPFPVFFLYLHILPKSILLTHLMTTITVDFGHHTNPQTIQTLPHHDSPKTLIT